MSPPRILLTTGEPAGIGPDLVIEMALRDWACSLSVIGDPGLLEARARRLGKRLSIRALRGDDVPGLHQPGVLWVRSTQQAVSEACGQLDPANSPYVIETLTQSARACLNGTFHAVVTPPVHKGVINQAGFAFTGHTEFYADITGGYPVMMLTVPGLRVALATTHLPLAKVSPALTVDLLNRVLRVLVADLQARFGIPSPRIAVCGLNPHAGESGYLGREELDVIAPALERLRAEGLCLTGPLPADTAFVPTVLQSADAILAMYHDQGLPVLKHAGFGRAVNVTLGLPIIRTSVDHGTALDLAGTGEADPGSLSAAIELAIELASRRSSAHP